MNKIAITALGVVSLVIGASAAFAQSNMSNSDTAMMNKCKAMSESAMKKDKDCMAMMKKHPDMMKSDSGMSGGMKK